MNMETRKIMRKCKWCGKSFYADIRNIERGWGLYCSKKCAAKAREQCKRDYSNEGGFGINNMVDKYKYVKLKL